MLVILDGWGLAPAGPANAISLASTPNFDSYWSHFPHTKLAASGEAVGLPSGQMGNSEVGHLNIGAGRVVLQDLPRISKSIKDGSFFQNKELLEAFEYTKKNHKPLHFIGLLSEGGIHSHEEHLFALLAMAGEQKQHNVYLHLITDGRDEPPKSALSNIAKLKHKIKESGVGEVASIMGRYYAMDRDKRWDRVELAYNAMVTGRGEFGDDATSVIENSYALGISDEFIRPTIICREGLIEEGDGVIFFNFRSDRPREIVRALIDPNFSEFKREKVVQDLYFVTMTEYDKTLPVSGIAFPEIEVPKTLSEVISKHGLDQFHLAETEKYPHVTFFFNGGVEKAVKGEERLVIPSPHVATYDLKPEMSAGGVTSELLKHIGRYEFIVVNYANADMVGHTGMLNPAIMACEEVDRCLGQIVDRARAMQYEIIVIADHGNIEKMVNADGSPCTSHTTNPVPFILITDDKVALAKISEPKLANVAPTVLDIMKLPQPKEMNERSLLGGSK